MGLRRMEMETRAVFFLASVFVTASSFWDRVKEWFKPAPRPEYDVNRAPGDDKARRAMYPEMTDAEYEAMARRNGWR